MALESLLSTSKSEHKKYGFILIVSNFELYWVFIEKGAKIERILKFILHILSRQLLQIITGSGFKIKSNFDKLQEIFKETKDYKSLVIYEIKSILIYVLSKYQLRNTWFSILLRFW